MNAFISFKLRERLITLKYISSNSRYNNKKTPKMMRKLTLTIATVAIMAASGWAQDISYPEKKLIEQGNYEKAAQSLEKDVSKHPDDCMLQYSLYILHSTKEYKEYSLYKAYQFLIRSKEFFANTDKVEKLTKQGINYRFYDQKIEELCQKALEEAKEANTKEAYNNFLGKFDKATPAQQHEACNCRISLEYKDIEKKNTLKDYQWFASMYSDSKEADEARQHIYELEYEIVQKQDTEDAYRQYTTKYPRSHHYGEAKLQLDKKVFQRKTSPKNWETYMQYISLDSPCDEMRKVAEDSILSQGLRHNIVRALEYCARSKNEDTRLKCALAIHKIWEELGVSVFTDFYQRFKGVEMPAEIQQKDAAVAAALKGSHEDIIRAAAPYRVAYHHLQEYIKADVLAGNYKAAAAKARSFETEFGQYKDYRALIAILEEPWNNNVKISAMPASINSADGNEYAPCISMDGKSFLFCGNGRADNLGAEDIFISRLNDKGEWMQAHLFPDVNTRQLSEAPEVLSADNTKLIMYQNGFFFQSQKTESGWSKPKSMGKVINFAEWQADATFSSNGRVMIFAAKSPTDREYVGSENIYVSILQKNGEWGKPFEIGPTINTPFCDRSPVLHPDMKTLYFCSNGHSALGSMDVFMTKRLSDDSWTEWSEPVNLGKEINSAESDCFYKVSTDGKVAYFSKQTNANEDLYMLTLPEKLRPTPVATISGKMLDTDGKPVVTTIYWEDLETHEIIGQSDVDPSNGSFFIVLPNGKNYGYFIDHKDYFPTSNNIDLRSQDKIVNIEKTITVPTIRKMIDEEIPMVMNNLFFETAKWDLLPASISELQRVAKMIKPLGLKIEISGHTDSRDDDQKNQILSERRANSAKQFLVEQGCDANLLITKGYGESKPIATNNTPEGMQLNRRVELRFVKE